MKVLLGIHRFLSNQHLYPVVLSTLLALGIFAGRVFLVRSMPNWSLVWNLFLAWVPYVFSFLAASLQRLFPRQGWLLLFPGLIWLAFFPNAPYLITDFIHLRERPPVPLWYDIGLMASFALAGLFLAIASLRTMQTLVKDYWGWLTSWIFAAGVLVLSGLGLYLGRFLRWNSWDLLLQPTTIFEDVAIRLANPFDNLRFIGFTLMFTALLMVSYLMFVSANPIKERKEE